MCIATQPPQDWEERAVTPAAEWLVDSFHVVDEQIREIRDDLPRG